MTGTNCEFGDAAGDNSDPAVSPSFTFSSAESNSQKLR